MLGLRSGRGVFGLPLEFYHPIFLAFKLLSLGLRRNVKGFALDEREFDL